MRQGLAKAQLNCQTAEADAIHGQIDVMRVMRAAESGSFRRAADESHVSKAQVCRAIASLVS